MPDLTDEQLAELKRDIEARLDEVNLRLTAVEAHLESGGGIRRL